MEGIPKGGDWPFTLADVPRQWCVSAKPGEAEKLFSAFEANAADAMDAGPWTWGEKLSRATSAGNGLKSSGQR